MVDIVSESPGSTTVKSINGYQTKIVPIIKNKRPQYSVYIKDRPLSEGARLMLQRMGMRWFAPLKCWTNAPPHWSRQQINLLIELQAVKDS
ncbi:MAG: hypothetical protein DRR06_16135 [Gammaproteobacteria bacterium]|nr:MAG: hypothetical protein DRR06_16135 [Gammaproteobacteria bacterium]